MWDTESRLQKKAKPSQALLKKDSSAKVYSELFQYLKEVVYDNTGAVLYQLNRCDTDCVFSNKMVKYDRAVGKMLELTANMPLVCSLEQLDALIWESLVNPSENKRAVEFIAQVSPRSFDQKLNLTVPVHSNTSFFTFPPDYVVGHWI